MSKFLTEDTPAESSDESDSKLFSPINRMKSLQEIEREQIIHPTTASDSVQSTNNMSKLDLSFAGKYDGSEPAERWLRRLDHDLEPIRQPDNSFAPYRWINSFAVCLIGTAATWAESHEGVQNIFELAVPNSSHIQQLRTWITEEFPIRVRSVQRFVDLDIQELHQGKDELLEDYYARGLKLANAAGTSVPVDGWTAAARGQNNMLRSTLRAWINGLSDRDVRMRCEDRMGDTLQPFEAAYNVAREVTESQARRTREYERERREQEYEMYKTIAMERSSRDELTTRLAALDINGNNAARPNVWQYDQPTGNERYGNVSSPRYGTYGRPPNTSHNFARPYGNAYGPRRAPAEGYSGFENRRSNQYGHSSARNNESYGRNNGSWKEQGMSQEQVIANSENPYINGTRSYTRDMGFLCVKCGRLGHRGPDCENLPLSWNEQQVLRDMCFGQPHLHSPRSSPPRGGNTPGPYNARPSPPMNNGAPTGNGHSVTASFNPDYYGTDENVHGSYRAEVMAAAGRPRKRVQVEMEDGEPEIDTGPTYEPTFPRSPKPSRKRAELAPIRALINPETGEVEKPVSIRQLLKEQKICLSLADFCQWSPTASAEARHLIGRMIKKRGKKRSTAPKNTDGPVTAAHTTTSAQNGKQNSSLMSKLRAEHRSFRVPATIKFRKGGSTTRLELPKSRTHADAGADMNCIAEPMVEEWGLMKLPLKKLGLADLSMSTANYQNEPLEYYVEFDIGVSGIWRTVQAVVVPASKAGMKASDNHIILLGLPWLYDVDAYIGIKESTIWIGSENQDERSVAVVGADQVFARGHKIMLCPKSLLHENDIEYNSEADDESENSESASDQDL